MSFWKSITIVLLTLFFVEGGILFVDSIRPVRFTSNAKYMVILEDSTDQKFSYNMASLANHQAVLTAEIVDTVSFIKNVYQRSGLIYDKNKIDEYRKKINVEVVTDTEIVEVSVTNDMPQRSQKICQSILDQLQEKSSSGYWNQSNFSIEILDPPSLPNKPSSPNLSQDLLVGFAASFLIIIFYQLLKNE